jgi:lipoyl(octanoyl) transferase
MEVELGEKIDEEAVKEKILKHFKTLFEVDELILS